ncbi:MAG: NifB/NifX family molybdenum-iron cluster-binding protein [Candidatus Korarchaeum sp.]
MRVLVPVIPAKDGLLISPHFGRAVAFALFEVEGDSYRFELYKNPAPPQQEGGRGRTVLSLVNELKPDAVIVRSIGPGAFERLMASGIRVMRSRDRLAEEAIRRFIGGELEEMREPESGHGP